MFLFMSQSPTAYDLRPAQSWTGSRDRPAPAGWAGKSGGRGKRYGETGRLCLRRSGSPRLRSSCP